MGHAKVDTTLNVYTQVIDGALRTAVDKVGSRIVHYCSQTGKGRGANSLKKLAPQAGLEPSNPPVNSRMLCH